VSSGDSGAKTAKSAGVLTDAVRARLPDLLVEMAGRESHAENLAQTLTINDAEDFAAWLKDLGDTNELSPLIQWADRLAEQTSMFEMEGMADTLKSYPALLEEIRSLT
jgi:hypothetical protein